jgi:hypothetical protein
MKMNEILEEWKTDTKLDDLNLDSESLNIPRLHSKYLTMLSDTRLKLRSLRIQRKQKVRELMSYYSGDLNNPEDLERIKRDPWAKKVLRSDIMGYVDTDPEITEHDAKIEICEEKVDVLTEIIKSINGRNYNITNAINFRKLTMGG